MENGWKLESIEMKDKWKDHGWKAWKWSVTRLTLHSAKPELAKVDSYLSSETECIQKNYCRKNFTEPSLWLLTTTPEHFEDAI